MLSRPAASPGLVTPGQLAQTAGYPLTRAKLQEAVGFGDWGNASAWLCDDASGHIEAQFGGPRLELVGSATYGVTGPLGGAEAVRLVGDGNGSFFYTASTAPSLVLDNESFDVGAGDDILCAFTFEIGAAVAASRAIIGKRGTASANWYVQIGSGVGGALQFVLNDATNPIVVASATDAGHLAGWHLGLAAFSRATNEARVITDLVSGAAVAAVVDSLTNTAYFSLGRYASITADVAISFAAVAVGPGIADDVIANQATALANLQAWIGM